MNKFEHELLSAKMAETLEKVKTDPDFAKELLMNTGFYKPNGELKDFCKTKEKKMNIEEAIEAGCPEYIAEKMRRAGVHEISRPHHSWEAVGRHVDVLYYKLHPEALFFGLRLKELRHEAGIGLRNFADKIEVVPSLLTDIEQGRVAPPVYPKFLFNVRRALRTAFDKYHHDTWNEFEKLYYAQFVMQKMDEEFCPCHVLTQDGQAPSEETLKGIVEEWRIRAQKHNAKADIYNAENKK